MKRERNYGIDLLRILSMFMVVILHIIGYSGLMERDTSVGTFGYASSWLLESAAYCAVNIFSMITGYLMTDRPFRYRKILPLWTQAFFYSVVLTFILFPFLRSSIGIKNFILSPFVVSLGKYWYFTAYFCMFCFIPFLNALTEKISKKQFTALIVTCVTLFSIVPAVFIHDIFYLNNGYSAFWLMTMYLLGAYIKKYGISEKIKSWVSVVLYGFAVFLTWASRMVLTIFDGRIGESVMAKLEKCLYNYTSPTMVIAAFALFALFAKIRIKEKGLLFSFTKLSPYTFAVYLIHMHPLVKTCILAEFCYILKELPGYLSVVSVLCVAAVVFFICIAIERLRVLIFKLLRINEGLDKLSDFVGRMYHKSKLGKKLEGFFETTDR